MNILMKRIVVAGTATVLLACAEFTYQQQPESAVNADEAYLIGRDFHLARRPEQALSYYQAALKVNPQHLRTRNGLAALYADQGKLDDAIALWLSLTKEVSGADSAYLFSNLGYAYALRGDLPKAEAALQKSCVMDPLNATAWEHLSAVLEKSGQHARARKMAAQAATLRGHDLKSDYALVPTARTPYDHGRVQDVAGQKVGAEWAQSEVQPGDNGVYVLKRVAARDVGRVAAPTPAAAPAPATSRFALPVVDGRPLMLEISNGNGVPGMAKALARNVGPHVRVVRLTNQKRFNVQQTRIEYQLPFREAAEKLAGRYGAGKIVEVAKSAGPDVRLVLGRDMPSIAAAPARSQGRAGDGLAQHALTFGSPQTRARR